MTERLYKAGSLVRENSTVYDIGSDHGYLPIYLLKSKKISRAVVTDLNEGPLSKAKENFALEGLKAEFILTDGLTGVSLYEGTNDITICGMGGELIAAILENRSDLTKQKDVHFVLQPMTQQDKLRSYLWDNGFYIEKEVAVTEGEKHYILLSVYYNEISSEYNSVELLIGKRESCFVNEPMKEYIEKQEEVLQRIINGKKYAGINTVNEEKTLKGIKEELEIRFREN